MKKSISYEDRLKEISNTKFKNDFQLKQPETDEL